VEDLYLWDQALYADKVVSAKSSELMYKPFLDNYAYGWERQESESGAAKESVNSVAHSGGIHGFSTLSHVTRIKKSHRPLRQHLAGRELDRITRDLTNILYNQPFEMPKQSIAEVLMKTLPERGDVAAAVKQYRELQATQAAAYDFGEGELNALGYQLLGAKKMKEAIEIFKLNVEAHPQAANLTTVSAKRTSRRASARSRCKTTGRPSNSTRRTPPPRRSSKIWKARR
jgi:hypothetical protein